MGHTAKIVHDWLVKAPIEWSLILFFLSGLVSLYSKQIREFLHTWPARTLNSFDKNVNINRLRLLEALHDNTYALVIYLAGSVVAVIQAAVIWNGVLALISIVFFHNSKESLPQLEGTILGIASGKSFQVGAVLKQLANYDASVAYMRKVIATHEAREAKKLTALAGDE